METPDAVERLWRDVKAKVVALPPAELEFLEHLFVVALAGAVEAALKDHMGHRRRRRDALYREFSVLKKRYGSVKNVPVEDILDAWKRARGIGGREVGAYKQVLQVRHWAAHGRTWPVKPLLPFEVCWHRWSVLALELGYPWSA